MPGFISAGSVLCKDDPMLAVYYKMVRVGVPPMAVAIKMQQRGLDPELLKCVPMTLSAGKVSWLLQFRQYLHFFDCIMWLNGSILVCVSFFWQ